MSKQNKKAVPGDSSRVVLSTEAQAWRDKILSTYELEDSGSLMVLQIALEAFDRLRDAQHVLAAEGIMVKDRFGAAQVHPACRIERDSRIALLHGIKQLQLDIEIPKS